MAWGGGWGLYIEEERGVRVGNAYGDGNVDHCEQWGESEVELGEDNPFPVTTQNGEVREISLFFRGWWM